MALSITILPTGVTKKIEGNNLRYDFPRASISARIDTGGIDIFRNGDAFGSQSLNYSDLTEVYGTSTVEEYLDYLADNKFFFDSSASVTLLPATPYQLAVSRGQIAGVEAVDKFGYNIDIDTGSTPESVWNGGGLYTGFPTGAAEALEIFSDSPADTAGDTGARTVEISNLLDSAGVRQPNVTVTLNGTTPVSLGASTYSRCSRMRVKEVGSAGHNVGEITLRHVITTANVFAVMPAESGSTQIACTTIPAGFELEIVDIVASMIRANGLAGSAQIAFRQRRYSEALGTWLSWTDTPRTSISNSFPYQKSSNYPLVLPPRTDVEMIVRDVSDNNTQVSAEFFGYLRAI